MGAGGPLGLTRRQFLGTMGRGAAALGLGAFLAACETGTDTGTSVDWVAWWRSQKATGVVDFANWPYYIDRRRGNSHPSLELFTKTTGTRVRYYRPIRDDEAFFERIRPDLRAGRSIGYDIIVITNGPQLTSLIQNEWLTPLDHPRLDNFGRYASPMVKSPPWDPGNRYTAAWQSGLTGIAYRPEAVRALGRAPRSILDLWHPSLVGRVGMMQDLLDLGSAGLLAIGVDPQHSSHEDWNRAAQKLLQQRAARLVRRYYDQGYLWALQKGDVWISQAWSGDIFQANQLGHPELRFVVPDEGAMFWTDNMMIPKGAQHPVDAMKLIDFVYRPDVAALIADWVWYICPVPAAKEIVAGRLGDPRIASSKLVFPDPRDLGQIIQIVEPGTDGKNHTENVFVPSTVRIYPTLGGEGETATWDSIFASVIGPSPA